MKKMLHNQPVFTWQQDRKNHSLFCGSVFLATLMYIGQRNGYEHYRIEHAAFPDALSEAGWGRWDGAPFNLKARTVVDIADMVEEFYVTVFGKLAFSQTHPQ